MMKFVLDKKKTTVYFCLSLHSQMFLLRCLSLWDEYIQPWNYLGSSLLIFYRLCNCVDILRQFLWNIVKDLVWSVVVFFYFLFFLACVCVCVCVVDLDLISRNFKVRRSEKIALGPNVWCVCLSVRIVSTNNTLWFK